MNVPPNCFFLKTYRKRVNNRVKKKKELNNPISTRMDLPDLLGDALIREYLNKKGYSKVLESFDEENVSLIFVK